MRFGYKNGYRDGYKNGKTAAELGRELTDDTELAVEYEKGYIEGYNAALDKVSNDVKKYKEREEIIHGRDKDGRPKSGSN